MCCCLIPLRAPPRREKKERRPPFSSHFNSRITLFSSPDPFLTYPVQAQTSSPQPLPLPTSLTPRHPLPLPPLPLLLVTSVSSLAELGHVAQITSTQIQYLYQIYPHSTPLWGIKSNSTVLDHLPLRGVLVEGTPFRACPRRLRPRLIRFIKINNSSNNNNNSMS